MERFAVRTPEIRGLAISALLMAGCGGVHLPSPQPEQLEPAKGYRGEDTLVVIRGEAFYPQVEIDSSGDGQADVDASFSVSLVSAEGERDDLQAVTFQAYDQLSAVVPAGLEAGVYDVLVQGPTGAWGSLEDGFTVTETRADSLRVEVDSIVWTVHETAPIHVELVSPPPLQQRVPEDLMVLVQVSGADLEDGDVEFSAGGLEEQALLRPDTLVGRLGEDGKADLGLKLTRPQEQVQITVSPAVSGTGIDPGSVRLSWEPGSELRLRMTLPEQPLTQADTEEVFLAAAGQPFELLLEVVDQYGNLVEDGPVWVFLTHQCGGQLATVEDIYGSTTVPVQITTATSACSSATDTIYAVSWILDGQTEPFVVQAGQPRSLGVEVIGASFTAGRPFWALVTGQDSWGNHTTFPGTPTLQDTLGGVDSFDCPYEGNQICQVRGLIAGEVRLQASTPLGLSGISEPYTLDPGAAASLSINAGSDPWVAGASTTVEVRAWDAWDNLVDATTLSPDTWTFTEKHDEIECALERVDPLGVAVFDCTLFTTSRKSFTVSSLDGSLTGASGMVEVVNGELAVVDVSPNKTLITAGSEITVLLTGYDAWGNEYLVQTNPDVDLTDTLGSVSTSATLDSSSASVTVKVSLDVAGSTYLVASQAGVELGRSSEITVDPAQADSLTLTLSAPWVWVDEDLDLQVTALDEFGNQARLSDTLTVSTDSGILAPFPMAISAGEGSTSIRWTDPWIDEVLTVSNSNLEVDTETFLVLEDCSQAGPALDYDFGGLEYAVACWDASTGEATITGDLSGSAAGIAALSRYGLWAGEVSVITTSDAPGLALEEVGVHDLLLVVADASACGTEASTQAWIGPNDGEPVGPLELTLADDSVDIGTGTSPTTTLSLSGATDCNADLAVGGTVYLRTSRGDLTGATASGRGLALTLGSGGSGSATLDLSAASDGGAGVVSAWVDSEAAWGQVSFAAEGDDKRPTVWEQSPRGYEVDVVDEIEVRFSEAVATPSTSDLRLQDDLGDTVDIDSVTHDGDSLVAFLSEALDASTGTWTLTISSDVRDAQGGLRLDGTGGGSSSDYEGTFGDISPGVGPVSTCSVSPATLRPDGDAGTGAEADEATLSATTAISPDHWVVSVWDEQGELIERERVSGGSTTASWSWDGRDQSEAVVDNGVYTLGIDTDDGSGNRGGECLVTVSIDNHGGEG